MQSRFLRGLPVANVLRFCLLLSQLRGCSSAPASCCNHVVTVEVPIQRLLALRGCHTAERAVQVTTWEVPYLFAWRKVFVDENNTVVESPEDEDWDDEGWTGEFLTPRMACQTRRRIESASGRHP